MVLVAVGLALGFTRCPMACPWTRRRTGPPSSTSRSWPSWSRSWGSAWRSTAPSRSATARRGAGGEHVAAARHHHATVHRGGRAARLGRRTGPSRRAPARRRAGSDRPRPGLRRPGRRSPDRRPRGRRVRRAPVHAHLGGGPERRAGVPLRLRRDPAGRGAVQHWALQVGRLLPDRKDRPRRARRPGGRAGAGLRRLPFRQPVPARRRAGSRCWRSPR